MVYDYVTHRGEMAHTLSISSSMIADSSSVMLAFSPPPTEASAVLARLKADQHIVAAALYDRNNRLFRLVPFPSGLLALFPPSPGNTGYKFLSQHLIYFQPVTEGDKWYGNTLC